MSVLTKLVCGCPMKCNTKEWKEKEPNFLKVRSVYGAGCNGLNYLDDHIALFVERLYVGVRFPDLFKCVFPVDNRH